MTRILWWFSAALTISATAMRRSAQWTTARPTPFTARCTALYTALTEKYPDVPVVILTPLHRLNEDSPKGDNKPAPVGTLKEYVNIIREVAEYYSLPVLDLFKESGLQPKIPVIQQKYVPDGLHPNDDGQWRF